MGMGWGQGAHSTEEEAGLDECYGQDPKLELSKAAPGSASS